MRTYARVKRKNFIEKVNSRCSLIFLLIFRDHIGGQFYGVSIQSSTKEREMFRQITQKLWATKK